MTLTISPPSRGAVTPESVKRFAELVNKIETSPSLSREQRSRRKKQRAALKGVIAEAKRMSVRDKTYALCMTLTYEDEKDFDAKNISRFIDKMRRWLWRVHKFKLVYAWVLESESCLHYHLIVWLPLGVLLDKKRLGGWWSFGSTWLERCISVSKWGSYMAKFSPPKRPLRKGTRLYGYGGLDDAAQQSLARKSMPVWLKKRLPLGERARRRKGGGWENLDTGEIYFSPYVWSPLGMLIAAAGRMPV